MHKFPTPLAILLMLTGCGASRVTPRPLPPAVKPPVVQPVVTPPIEEPIKLGHVAQPGELLPLGESTIYRGALPVGTVFYGTHLDYWPLDEPLVPLAFVRVPGQYFSAYVSSDPTAVGAVDIVYYYSRYSPGELRIGK